eukprot:snap_masked-scaffold_2-processed-gene-4.35-mRNA-1 protein AED:1.00 eAED:1.00 QI:0/0/0/0/1/1/2/0/67
MERKIISGRETNDSSVSDILSYYHIVFESCLHGDEIKRSNKNTLINIIESTLAKDKKIEKKKRPSFK